MDASKYDQISQKESQSSFSQIAKSKTGNKSIWAIAGGKGGVGKSLITANMSICLSLLGHKTVAIDLDLGGANLHTCLGVAVPEKTLSDLLYQKVENIEELISPTNVNDNLFIVSGAQDSLEMANLKNIHQKKILSQLKNLDADYILFDLGAGTGQNTLDFFLAANTQILAVLPEPTSIENTYRFIKSCIFRKLQHLEEDTIEFHPLIQEVMNSKIHEKKSPAELLQHLAQVSPELKPILDREIGQLKPKIIMNQVRTQTDINIGFSMKSVCQRYFGIELDYIGYLDYDITVWQSVKKRQPLLMEYPNSPLVANFDKIVHRLLSEN